MPTAAALIQLSKPPNSCTACQAIRSTSLSRPTSAVTWIARPPFALISSAALCSASSLRAASTSAAPRSAAMRAVVRPMPLEAPVMTMTCRSNGFSRTVIVRSSHRCRRSNRGRPARVPRPGTRGGERGSLHRPSHGSHEASRPGGPALDRVREHHGRGARARRAREAAFHGLGLRGPHARVDHLGRHRLHHGGIRASDPECGHYPDQHFRDLSLADLEGEDLSRTRGRVGVASAFASPPGRAGGNDVRQASLTWAVACPDRARNGRNPQDLTGGASETREAFLSSVVVKSPMQYLDKATGALRELGLMPAKVEDAPINALLEKISDFDQDKITIIARTLGQASVFNEIVRQQIAAVEIGQRYQEIAQAFNSIRDDANQMVEQIEDGRIDLLERITNVWVKISRGDVADRFDEIKAKYLEVTRETKNQIERESVILDAYRDFRGALKQAEVLALEVLEKATQKLNAEKAELAKAAEAVAGYQGSEVAERARLELIRDEHLRRTQDEEKRYQIAKDLSDNLTVSYNTSEVIMARLMP